MVYRLKGLHLVTRRVSEGRQDWLFVLSFRIIVINGVDGNFELFRAVVAIA